MAVLSASRDRRGCKYGLWLGLGVLAARCLGGEYSRVCAMCRGARACVRTVHTLLWMRVWCVRAPGCVYDAPDGKMRGNASRRCRVVASIGCGLLARECDHARGRLPSALQMCNPTTSFSVSFPPFVERHALVHSHARTHARLSRFFLFVREPTVDKHDESP